MQRDNPVLTEDVLLTQQPFGESAERVGDSKWVYTAFDTEVRVSGTSLLYIVATGHNAFSPSATTGGEFLHTWPAAAGTWTPSSLPVQMPWELHGARFGYWTSTVTVSKVLADSSTVPSSNIARIRVDPGVLIVPIQAVLVLPNYPSPDLEAVMQQFDERSQGVLWDDRWRAKRQRTSHPGGLLSQVAGQWTYRSEVTRVIEPDDRKLNGISGLTMPDEVFDLCKIQFRLVSFHELRVDKELFELIREDGPDEHFLCDPAFEIRPRMFHARRGGERPSRSADRSASCPLQLDGATRRVRVARTGSRRCVRSRGQRLFRRRLRRCRARESRRREPGPGAGPRAGSRLVHGPPPRRGVRAERFSDVRARRVARSQPRRQGHGMRGGAFLGVEISRRLFQRRQLR